MLELRCSVHRSRNELVKAQVWTWHTASGHGLGNLSTVCASHAQVLTMLQAAHACWLVKKRKRQVSSTWNACNNCITQTGVDTALCSQNHRRRHRSSSLLPSNHHQVMTAAVRPYQGAAEHLQSQLMQLPECCSCQDDGPRMLSSWAWYIFCAHADLRRLPAHLGRSVRGCMPHAVSFTLSRLHQSQDDAQMCPTCLPHPLLDPLPPAPSI